jgi:hypothetical protein
MCVKKFEQALNEPATEPGRPQEWLRIGCAFTQFGRTIYRQASCGNYSLESVTISLLRSPLAQGGVAATLRKMSNKQVVQFVDRIMAFCRKLRDAP